jgi:small-conductance mechanosensitive channel
LGDYAVGYVNEAIDKAFKENDITIPYPHVTLTYDSPTQKKQAIQ